MRVAVKDQKKWLRIARVVTRLKRAKDLTEDEADVAAGCLVALAFESAEVGKAIAQVEEYFEDQVKPMGLTKDQRQNWLRLLEKLK